VRAVVGCATLNIKDPVAWHRLYSIAQGAAAVLQPRELALCAWGLARSRMPHTPASVAAWAALLQRAQLLQDADSKGLLGFDRIAALSLSWAMVASGLAHLAPASLLHALVLQALGPGYQSWLQQQQQQQQQHQVGVVIAAAAAEGGSSGLTAGLLPQEACALMWTLAAASTQQQKVAAAVRVRQLTQPQAGGGVAGAIAALNPQDRQQQQQQQQSQERWGVEVQVLLQDQQLHMYLAAEMECLLQQQVQQRHLAQLAQTAAALDNICRTVTCASAAAEARATEHSSSSGSSRSMYGEVVHQIWCRVLQLSKGTSQGLEGVGLPEVSLLLQSVAAMQQQQQQQHGQAPAAAVAAAADSVIAAAVQRILSARPSELPSRTAVVLLHHFAVLRRTAATAHQSPGAVLQDTAAAAAAAAAAASVTVRLVHAVCMPGAISQLRDRELVLAAVAAGQLAAAGSSSSSSSSDSTQRRGLRLLLQQLALPLAAVASSLNLRSLANVSCAYAAVGQQSWELFNAVADAIHNPRVLKHGSSWALARTLAAFAAVGYVDEGLFDAVADALTPRLRAGHLHPRVLAKLAGALAAVGAHDAAVFADIAVEVVNTAAAAAAGDQMQPGAGATSTGSYQRPVLPWYQPQDVSNLAWALATAGFKETKPFQVLAAAGAQLLADMAPSQAANLLWGCAVAGVRQEQLLAAAVNHLIGLRYPHCLQQQEQQQQQQHHGSFLASAAAADVSTIAWSLSTLQVHEPAVFAACAQHFVQHVQRYSAADAADLAWALAWASASSSSSSQAGGSVDLSAVLQQLLRVCESDVDALSPQQSASLGLVTAALTAGCIPAAYRSVQPAGKPALSSSNSSSSGQRGVVGDQWWVNVASWGPAAFSAADGAMLLWAQLLSACQGQQQQQQQGTKGKVGVSAAPGARGVTSKLLSSGARVLVHQTAAICGSAFGLEVLSALQAIKLSAQPSMQHQQQQQQQQASVGGRRSSSSSGAAATAAAAAAAATAVAATLAPTGNPSSSSSSSSSVWEQLGPVLTSQLLGHFVLTVPRPGSSSWQRRKVAASVEDTPQQSQLTDHLTAAGATGQTAAVEHHRPADLGDEGYRRFSQQGLGQPQSEQQVSVLLHLVPQADLCWSLPGGPGFSRQEGWQADQTWSAQRVPQSVQLSWRGVVCRALLQQQPHFVAVVLTQHEWGSWGGGAQRLRKLQQVIAAAAQC
jgi:hypothetical protein